MVIGSTLSWVDCANQLRHEFTICGDAASPALRRPKTRLGGRRQSRYN